ncbi:thiamine pyrophosphate-dependent enzyme [Desulfosediminicola flagellatus]|uniref:thiamine pyrophosphate-dependent enzyme n=1 Tax=Desulfosediminicola flagellatus TaxID=2569541 RepID=UPI0010ABF308|nr:thiamine pyrophosphate-dependent enzyme [Desulfosediminicola flagellatus]
MNSLLNDSRPLVFCPGCAHEKVVRALDTALCEMGLAANRVALVTDIGCSGLFDTFFNTHAMHGLHGRALTYATGLKMADPDLTVITVMGDGGMGIGGAHVLSSCRRNLDITLLVLNNFNYGMTGGQFSATTPEAAITASGFLNQLEPPLDICAVAAAAGAPWVARADTQDRELTRLLRDAVNYEGFSLLEMQGFCTGRYTKRNAALVKAGNTKKTDDAYKHSGPIGQNQRDEFGANYRKLASQQKSVNTPAVIAAEYPLHEKKRLEILLLGAAGQRINTAGELLCIAAMSAGMQVTQKNDYPITVLRGHSVCEVIISPSPVGYTGIRNPDIIVALDQAGVNRRKSAFTKMNDSGLVICASDVALPETVAKVITVDFAKEYRVSSANRALFSLVALAQESGAVSVEMLETALAHRFAGKTLSEAKELMNRNYK